MSAVGGGGGESPALQLVKSLAEREHLWGGDNHHAPKKTPDKLERQENRGGGKYIVHVWRPAS